jgi:hypothetical protein
MASTIKNNQLLEGPIITSLFKLSLPIIAANVLQAACQLADLTMEEGNQK